MYYKPYKERMDNYMDIFNEGCLLIASCPLITFSDFLESGSIKYSIGWSVIGCTIFNLLVNMVVLLYKTVVLLKKYFKECKLRR